MIRLVLEYDPEVLEREVFASREGTTLLGVRLVGALLRADEPEAPDAVALARYGVRVVAAEED